MILTQRKYSGWDALRIPFRISPFLMLVHTMIVILMATLPTSILAMVTAQFINVANNIFNGTEMIEAIYLPFIFLLLILGIISLLSPILNIIETKLFLKLEQVLLPELVEKQARLPYQYIEDAKSWELMDRLTSEMTQTFMEGVQGYSTFLQSAVAIISVSGLLLRHVWWAALVLIGTSSPLFAVSIYWGKKQYEAKVQTRQYERLYSYYSDEILTSREAVEERTLFSYSNAMVKRYYSYFVKARNLQLNVLLKSYVSMKSTNIILIIISILTLLPMISALMNKQLTSGIFIGVATALFSMVESLGWSFQNAIKYIAEAKEYMQELSFLMSLEGVEGATDQPISEIPKFESTEFIDVWFKYPNSESYILKGLSLKILAGRHYAFVGVNGSGKTTILKLLTGLYESYEGLILINGKDIKSYPSAHIKAMFSVVYQDFAKYHLSIKDNIHLADIGHDIDLNKLKASIDQSGLNELINELPNGIESDLGKLSFNSRELSGGQWQRIALARSLYSTAPIKILDEPTAALDPVAESKLYQMFGQLMTDKTSLLITHRLGATKLVNEIFVISQGRVIESGDHASLMNLDGDYAQMYRTQEAWYHEE